MTADPARIASATRTIKYVIRDRDGEYPDLFDAILADANAKIALSGVRVPCTNSIMESWAQPCGYELLDRTLIRDQAHLLHVLREHEIFFNTRRPHRGISNARPPASPPEPITDPGKTVAPGIRRRDRLGDILHEYDHAAWAARTRFSASAPAADHLALAGAPVIEPRAVTVATCVAPARSPAGYIPPMPVPSTDPPM